MEEPKVPEEEEIDFETPAPREGRRTFPTVIVLATVVAALVAAVLVFRRGWEREASAPAPVSAPAERARDLSAAPSGKLPPAEAIPEAPQEEEPVGKEMDLPALDASDELVRGFAAGVPVSWLAAEELIRRFVVAVDNVADGYSPRRHFPSVVVEGKFTAVGRDGRLLLDPASYRRYDALADIAAGIDAAGWARAYNTLQPLCEEAYRDLGYPDRKFDDTLWRAVERLLAVPVVEGDILLVKQEGAYYFDDPGLEGLSAAGKHLLRMGPKNTRKVQGLLRALEAALSFP